MDYAHLSAASRQTLDLPDADRIERIRRPRWIGYTRAKMILAELDDLLTHPKTHRMPNLLIIGETNNGKTVIARRFQKLHPAHDNVGGDGIRVPVLAIQAPPVPDEARFYSAILEAVFAPYKQSDRVDKKQFQAIRVLQRVRVGMLVIDEIHHILAGSSNRQRQLLNVIKYLGNELQVPVVGIGTADALRAMQGDPQLANRFRPTVLPRWVMDDEYLKLLASFEQMLPLRMRSDLTEERLAAKLHAMSEGILGELSQLLVASAILAVESGAEQITTKILDRVAWIPPSERSRRAARTA